MAKLITKFTESELKPSNLTGMYINQFISALDILENIKNSKRDNNLPQIETLVHITKAYNHDKFKKFIDNLISQIYPNALDITSPRKHEELLIAKPETAKIAAEQIALYSNILNLNVAFVCSLETYNNIFNAACQSLGVQVFQLEKTYIDLLEKIYTEYEE
ncbi:MAG: hypothetical protein CFH44_00342 [Proteobacteria bacterium]|nr:MAG: hypothetical protein CFH44_00342 [Pseudomonadota bacterium]|tara:strand:- start:290 stop:772 length:483 start_codon:yes stop_codon:yes gene_type:complete